jgi:hypothetical protein
MKDIPLAGASIVMSLVILNCSAGEATGGTHAPDARDTILVQGRLNVDMVRDVEAKLTHTTRRIVVNSAGGRGAAAMRIATIANSRNLEIVVDGVCLSACAHFLFLPAQRRAVAENSVVAFHRTATAIHRSLMVAGRPDLAKPYASVAQQEAEFYSRNGLSIDALLVPFNEVQPVCYAEDLSVPASSEYRTKLYFVHAFYTPSLTQLRSWGVKEVSGKWPSTLKDIADAVPRYPSPLRGSFKIALTEHVPRKVDFNRLRPCPAKTDMI